MVALNMKSSPMLLKYSEFGRLKLRVQRVNDTITTAAPGRSHAPQFARGVSENSAFRIAAIAAVGKAIQDRFRPVSLVFSRSPVGQLEDGAIAAAAADLGSADQ